MSKAFLAAKEKYQAVLDDPGRADYYCRSNRYGASRHPSLSHEVSRVDHPERRRSSASAASLANSPTMREKIRSWMNRPAY
ncbi:hypothetical protein F5Y18DRAFT_91529 [Xylariaceae sp. FL1019]|nr:hypothetical protein F5Y18DRAFT_91529 [Xylariaceae sp. FL1019]